MEFELRYDRWMLPFTVPLGNGPKKSVVRIDDGALHVQMGWGFEAEVPLTSITSASHWTGRVTAAWGVHGWRGRYLVNGSSHGIVELLIDPPVPARVAGVPVKLRDLAVSVSEPDALIAACAPS